MSGETYNVILDTEIDPESPFTESLALRYRDNPIAMIQGASGAPRATSKIITPGGSDVDGAVVDGTTFANTPGFYDVSSIVWTVDKILPWITKMRVNGNASFRNLATPPVISCLRPYHSVMTEVDQQAIIDIFNGLGGTYGVFHAGDDSAGGGGAIGAGGNSHAGALGGPGAILAAAFNGTNRAMLLRKVLVGGNTSNGASIGGSPTTRGGGHLSLMVNGDLDLRDCTISVAGPNGESNGAGGGGGGSLYIFCNGTVIHNANTFLLANGGNGDPGGPGEHGGGGGGGVVGVFAKAFTGAAMTRSVAGGTSGGSGTSGAAGVDLGLVTIAEEVLNSLLLGAVQ